MRSWLHPHGVGKGSEQAKKKSSCPPKEKFPFSILHIWIKLAGKSILKRLQKSRSLGADVTSGNGFQSPAATGKGCQKSSPKRISPRPCPLLSEEQTEVPAGGSWSPRLVALGGVPGFPQPSPGTQHARPLQKLLPMEVSSNSTTEKDVRGEAGRLSRCSHGTKLPQQQQHRLPSSQAEERLKESWDAGIARHPSASGMPADLDFVSCCFRPRARIHPEKTPHNTRE